MTRAKSRTIRAKAMALQDAFETAGATPVECAILQPAEVLLDLYGEDIRARAYVSSDPEIGEVMLRPDFTVPVVEMHMRDGAEPARYTYAGEVFRRQEDHPDRASEYLQVGYEVFDRADAAAADAEVFSTVAGLIDGLGLRSVTGDIGILRAAVAGLETSQARQTALLRHIWRPRRFRNLIDRYAGRLPVPATRQALLDGGLEITGPEIGLRGRGEIMGRVEALTKDAAVPPLSEEQVALLDAVLSVKETCPFALTNLRDIAVDLPALSPALDLLEARMSALGARGVDVEALPFEASYGRTSMEYYDGFVFGFVSPAHPDWSPVALGGRYDALTRQLGRGAAIPAVGGVIRPDLMCTLEAEAAR